MVLCVIPARAHSADPGLLVCDRHLQQLSDWLYDIDTEAAMLDARPSMAVDWDRSRSGTLASHRAPVRLDVTALTDRRLRAGQLDELSRDDTLSAFGVLHAWAALVREHRMLGMPTLRWTERLPGAIGPFCEECTHVSCEQLRWRRNRPHRLDVTTERQLLIRHLGWIATQPWVPQLYTQLRRLRDQLKVANGTSDPKPLTGRCPRFDEYGNDCAGRLWPVTPLHTTGRFVATGPEAVQCDRDKGHRWEGVDLVRLAYILEQEQAS